MKRLKSKKYFIQNIHSYLSHIHRESFVGIPESLYIIRRNIWENISKTLVFHVKNLRSLKNSKWEGMRDMVIPSKRPRAPSFSDKHREETQPATTIGSGWFQEKGKLKTFLELCGFCKKKLRHDENVFMYG